MSSEYVVVVAIDFGTTFSGYAFSFRSNPEDIKMNKNWGGALGFQSYKTPTCVLINPRGEFDAFGFEAENTYGKYLEEDHTCEGRWQLYRHFKMILHQKEILDKTEEIASCSGKMKPAFDIFVFALRYLKNHLLDILSSQSSSVPNTSMVRWVITVPAIWTEQSKHFMREAAEKAGLIKTVDSTQLVIALEPECASLYCRRLTNAEFINDPDEDSIQFNSGTKYLIIDCGGGTVDITAHQIGKNNTVRELLSASGGDWAGKKVDEAFIKLLGDVLGEDFIKYYRHECPQQWLCLMTAFETAKKHVKPDGDCRMSIPLSWAINGKYEQFTKGQKLDETVNGRQAFGMSFRNGSLVLQHYAVKKLFAPTINRIIDHVERLMGNQKLHPLKYFFLVGGFSECAYLQSLLMDRFAGRVHVLIPAESQMAVIRGAVLYGHNQEEITSRVSRKTYGCRMLQTFDPSKHKSEKRVVYEGIAKCKDLFKVFVEKDEEVAVGEERDFEFTVVESKQEGADFILLSLDRTPDKVQYVDDQGVKEIGKIHVEMPDLTGGLQRVVSLNVTFGGTELSFNAKDKTSGKTANCKMNFLAV